MGQVPSQKPGRDVASDVQVCFEGICCQDDRAADRLPGTVLIDSIPSGEDRLNILQGSGAMRYKLRGCGSQLLRPMSMAGPLQCSGI